MDARNWMLPAAALVGGAVLGRLVGFRRLMRIGVAALTLASVSEQATLLPARKRAKPARGVPRKRAAKRAAHRRAPARKVTAVPAGAQTH